MAIYKVLEGTFHVKGFSPDGDSIRFQAKNAKNWDFFTFSTAAVKKTKKHQLRIEAIDALETHYEGARQPHSFAVAALERMLELIGITDIMYNLMVTKITAANDGTPGFIASANVDKFDRPVSYIFPPTAPLTDGQEFEARDLPIEHSINLRMAQEAIVYPTFYTSMEPSLVAKMRTAFHTAKTNKQGLWAIDRTGGFRLWNTLTVQEDVIILPKFFRRFISFFESASELKGFKEYLKKNNDKIVVKGQPMTFADIIEINGNHYRMTVSPEDILFVPT